MSSVIPWCVYTRCRLKGDWCS